MPSNIGSQTICLKFFDALNSAVLNNIAKDVRKVGIYSGGYLTKVSDVSVTLSALTCEISDGTYQVRGATASTVTVTVATGTPYVVLRWTYTGSASADYMDFLAVAVGSILSTDVVVGKCSFSGATLTGFDYASRTNPNVMDLFLKTEPRATPDMYVMVRAGRANYSGVNYDIATQVSPLFTAPVSNSRIDLLQINTSGALIVTQGTAAASPTVPSYGGLITLAEVTLTSGQTTITSSSIKDVRSFTSITFSQSQITGVLGSWVDKSASYGAQQATTDGFITVHCSLTDAGGTNFSVLGYTDSSSNPTTIRTSNNWKFSYNTPTSGYCGITFPVKKSDYWKVVTSGSGLTSIAVYWIPLGS